MGCQSSLASPDRPNPLPCARLSKMVTCSILRVCGPPSRVPVWGRWGLASGRELQSSILISPVPPSSADFPSKFLLKVQQHWAKIPNMFISLDMDRQEPQSPLSHTLTHSLSLSLSLSFIHQFIYPSMHPCIYSLRWSVGLCHA
jgi:hypothetical protein